MISIQYKRYSAYIGFKSNDSEYLGILQMFFGYHFPAHEQVFLDTHQHDCEPSSSRLKKEVAGLKALPVYESKVQFKRGFLNS